jgi:uncharacterized membrane protein HdeD (DUF308 family)
MAAFTSGNPVLLIKKLAGVLLLILGLVLVLAATGLSQSYNGLTVLGTLVLVTGIVLLIMKIVRRNQPTN